jgi:mannose-1-phosphate guanylyltransferase
MKIIIMAGGSGTRLWPVSTKKKPKQFQKLIGEKTLLQESVERLLPKYDPKDILVATNYKYFNEVREELPDLLEDNILLEPEKRDTAPAIGFATVLSGAKDEETVVFLTSDHFIQKKERFLDALRASDRFLKDNPGYILTLGITPTYPETGYGYIKYEKISELDKYKDLSVRKVDCFVEKPDYEKAQEYILSGNFVWNSGMFIVKKKTILELFKKHQPDTYSALKEIQKINSKNEDDKDLHIAEAYSKTEKISIDFGIMEKAKKIAVIPVDIGWSDVGSWAALKDVLSGKEDHHRNVSGEHIDVDSKGLLVHASSKKLVATLGLRDIVIVETEDVLFVCPKERSQDVKKMVALLEEKQSDKI